MQLGHLSTTKVWRKDVLCLATIIVGTFLLYANGLDIPWYFDDYPVVVENLRLQNFNISVSQILTPRGPVYLSFALNKEFFGMGVTSFHLVNISLHAVTGFLVFLLLKRVTKDNSLLALIGAMIFVCHPLQTQTVNYIVQRIAGLCGLFSFTALYFFVRARENNHIYKHLLSASHIGLYLTFSLFTGLAVLCKENAATLPLLFLLFDIFFLPQDRLRNRISYLLPLIIIPAIAGIKLVLLPLLSGHSLPALGNFEDLHNSAGITPLHYFVTELSVFWIYLKLFFWPHPQMLDYGYPVTEAIVTIKNIIAAIANLLLIAAAFIFRKRWSHFSFAVFWFYSALLVESSFIPLDPVFEHRLYIPMFGFAVFLLMSVDRLHLNQQLKNSVLVLLILVCAGLTIARTNLWNNPIAFFSHDKQHTYQSYRPGMMLADAYAQKGDWVNAQKNYEEIAELLLKQGFSNLPPKMLFNLAVAYERSQNYLMAEKLLKVCIIKAPREAKAHYSLGVAYYHQSKFLESFLAFQKAYQLAPHDAKTINNYGHAALKAGDIKLAVRLLEKLEVRNPELARELAKEISLYKK